MAFSYQWAQTFMTLCQLFFTEKKHSKSKYRNALQIPRHYWIITFHKLTTNRPLSDLKPDK